MHELDLQQYTAVSVELTLLRELQDKDPSENGISQINCCELPNDHGKYEGSKLDDDNDLSFSLLLHLSPFTDLRQALVYSLYHAAALDLHRSFCAARWSRYVPKSRWMSSWWLTQEPSSVLSHQSTP